MHPCDPLLQSVATSTWLLYIFVVNVVFICLQLNNFISLRCVSQSGITLYFSCQSETAKFPVGMVQGAKPVKLAELVCLRLLEV